MPRRSYYHSNKEKCRKECKLYRRTARGKESRWRSGIKKYGMTTTQYNDLLRGQDGKCAICRTPDPAHGIKMEAKRRPQRFHIEAGYRNALEDKVAKQLTTAGIEFDYEGLTLPVEIPARMAKAKPDFPCRRSNIIIETKGHFGGPKGRTEASAAARKKLLLLKEQHPGLDIRLVFQNANTRIYSGSKTTNGKWAEDHGFQWSDLGIVPHKWLDEIKRQQRKVGCRNGTHELARNRSRTGTKNKRNRRAA